MQERIFIISDIEMGRGDIMDDFKDDDIFVDFMEKIGATSLDADTKTTLVLNGDIFDFLKMSYKDNYPRYITEDISRWKLDQVIQSHPKFFAALKKFLQHPHNHVYFVIGNHDADMVWPSLQKMTNEILQSTHEIPFDFWYRNKDIHAEHGHLFDSFFGFDHKKPFLKYKKQQILNLPWGAHICFQYLVKIKKMFPLEEQMFPKKTAILQNTALYKESIKMAFTLGFKEIFLNPLIRFYDPTYRAPFMRFIKHLYHHGLEIIDDGQFIHRYINEITHHNPHKKIIVISHVHTKGSLDHENHKIFITDTWREEFDITKNNRKKKKSYVEICYVDDILQDAELKTFIPTPR
jgi:hypothetical protein